MSSLKVKAIIFDCGAVILSNAWNSEGGEPSYDVIPERLGISKSKGSEIFHKHWPEIMVGKKSENVFFQDLLSIAQKKMSLGKLRELYYSCILEKEALETVKKLHEKYPDLLLYILNNEGKEWMDVRIRKFELQRYFNDFITSGYIGYAKPDKRIYEVLLERAGVEVKECLFIDNKESLLVPAREMGFQVILFRSRSQLERELNSYGIEL